MHINHVRVVSSVIPFYYSHSSAKECNSAVTVLWIAYCGYGQGFKVRVQGYTMHL